MTLSSNIRSIFGGGYPIPIPGEKPRVASGAAVLQEYLGGSQRSMSQKLPGDRVFREILTRKKNTIGMFFKVPYIKEFGEKQQKREANSVIQIGIGYNLS